MRSSRAIECHNAVEVLDFVFDKLRETVSQNTIANQTYLMTEEVISSVMDTVNPSVIWANYSRSFGESTFKFRFKGVVSESDISSEDEIAGSIINHYSDNIKFQYKNGYTVITILVRQSSTDYTKKLIASIIMSIMASIVLEIILTEKQLVVFSDSFLWPTAQLFIGTLLLVSTPVTFICLVSNIANYSGLVSKFPSIRKVALRYFGTSLMSAVIGLVIFYLAKPFLSLRADTSYVLPSGSHGLTLSSLSTAISGIVPTNLFQPFIEQSSLKLLFLAILIGVAVAAVEREQGGIQSAVDTIKALFCKMLTIIFHFTPIMLFVVVMTLIMYEGISIMSIEMLILLFTLLGMLILCGIYAIMLLAHGHSPFEFYQATRNCFKNVFKLGSSIDAVPYTIKTCNKKLNLPLRPLEVAIPLGASINMDAVCMTETFMLLALEYCCGYEITIPRILLILVLVLGVSIGAPNRPGTLTIVSFVVLPQLGVSTEVIATILFIEVVINRLLATINVAGDVVTAKIVGEQERRAIHN